MRKSEGTMDFSFWAISFGTIGAALGYVSTWLIVWDRLRRGRPYARLSAMPFLQIPGAQTYLYVEVVNPSRYPIIVRPVYRDDDLRPSLGSDNRSVLGANFGVEFDRPIDAEKSCPFTVLPPSDFQALPPSAIVKLRFRWWPAQTRWSRHPGYPLTIRISKDRLDAMLRPNRHESDEDAPGA